MKRLIFILLVFSYSAYGQINSEPVVKWASDSSFYNTVKIISKYEFEPVAVEDDTIRYQFKSVPRRFYENFETQTVYNVDSTIMYKSIKSFRAVLVESGNIHIQQKVYRYRKTTVEPTDDEKMIMYLIRSEEMNITDRELFWTHTKVTAITNPQLDTIIE